MEPMIWLNCPEMKYLDNVTLYIWLNKGHVQNIGAIAQEFSHYIIWHGNFYPKRVMYEMRRQKQQ